MAPAAMPLARILLRRPASAALHPSRLQESAEQPVDALAKITRRHRRIEERSQAPARTPMPVLAVSPSPENIAAIERRPFRIDRTRTETPRT
jgi:hypothetical protein